MAQSAIATRVSACSSCARRKLARGQGAIRGEWGLGFPEIRKKRRLVDCSDVHDQRDESKQRKRDREESERD